MKRGMEYWAWARGVVSVSKWDWDGGDGGRLLSRRGAIMIVCVQRLHESGVSIELRGHESPR